MDTQIVPVDNSPWTGAFRYDINARWEGGSWNRTGGNDCYFKVPALDQQAIRARAALRALYSKGAIDVVLPFALATLAGSVCLIRLGGFAVKLV